MNKEEIRSLIQEEFESAVGNVLSKLDQIGEETAAEAEDEKRRLVYMQLLEERRGEPVTGAVFNQILRQHDIVEDIRETQQRLHQLSRYVSGKNPLRFTYRVVAVKIKGINHYMFYDLTQKVEE